MNDNENGRHQMFVLVREFGAAHANDFAANSLGKALFTNISTIITERDGHASAEASGIGSARQGTSTRTQARGAFT